MNMSWLRRRKVCPVRDYTCVCAAARTVTQTTSPLNTIPDGALPTLIVLTTSLRTGSIRETVPPFEFATHTRPPPTVTAVGPAPTWIVVVAFVNGSIRVTVSFPVLATQIAPSPSAIPVGRRPTRIGRPRAPLSRLCALKRVTVPSPEFATQTDPF